MRINVHLKNSHVVLVRTKGIDILLKGYISCSNGSGKFVLFRDSPIQAFGNAETSIIRTQSTNDVAM